MTVGVLVALLGVLAFAILFQVPRWCYLPCAVVGAAVWLVYQLLLRAGAGDPAACMGAALLLTLLSRTLAVLWRVPVSIFLIPGSFTLVPGVGIFYLGYYLVSGQTAQFSAMGTQVLLTAGGIAAGLAFGSALPQLWFNRVAEQVRRLPRRKRKG